MSRKIQELEEELDNSRLDHSEISLKLEEARKGCQHALEEGETRGRQFMETTLKEKQMEERKIVMIKFDELTDANKSLEKQVEDSSVTVASFKQELESARNALPALERKVKEYQDSLDRSRVENMQLTEELEQAKLLLEADTSRISTLEKMLNDIVSPQPVSKPDPDAQEDDDETEIHLLQDRYC